MKKWNWKEAMAICLIMVSVAFTYFHLGEKNGQDKAFDECTRRIEGASKKAGYVYSEKNPEFSLSLLIKYAFDYYCMTHEIPKRSLDIEPNDIAFHPMQFILLLDENTLPENYLTSGGHIIDDCKELGQRAILLYQPSEEIIVAYCIDKPHKEMYLIFEPKKKFPNQSAMIYDSSKCKK